MSQLLHDPKVLVAIAGLAIVAVIWLAYALFRTPEYPEEIERKRRLQLNHIGRIAEGHVVELVEQAAEPAKNTGGLLRAQPRPLADGGGRKLVSYSYAISGVTYQTAQDITGLDSQVRFDRLVAGQPASVKYDPSNPSNSIVAADDWSGLR